MLTDKEIIDGLIAKDNKVTEKFFFVKCRPLMYSIIAKFFGYDVNYDELINELYAFLMEKDAKVLRSFRFESSLCQWLKRVAFNFFCNKKNRGVMIEDRSGETPFYKDENDDGYDQSPLIDTDSVSKARTELSLLLPQMKNERHRFVLEKLFLEGVDYDELSKMTGLSKKNLYNMKKRGLDELLEIVSDEK